MTSPSHARLEQIGLAVAGALLVLVLGAPMAGLLASTGLDDLARTAATESVGRALRLSLSTSLASTGFVVLFGTPLAWALARGEWRASRFIEVLVQVPIVLPPSVAGVALLLAFGQRGVFSGWLYPRGSSIAFTTTAVVVAEIFVSAPFYLQAATAAFRRIDPRVLLVARSLGAPPTRVFSRVAVPIALPGLVAGAAMTWARALGEFGATLMFAGNMEGRTQTLPLAIYTALESDLGVARSLSVLLVAVGFGVLFLVRALRDRSEERT